MKKQRKPPEPPLGALVQQTQCATCIYRPETPYDTEKLEKGIRDPKNREHFTRPRACHAFTGRTVVCREFWNRHAQHCDLGQLATRLDAVYMIDDAGTVTHTPQHGLPTIQRKPNAAPESTT